MTTDTVTTDCSVPGSVRQATVRQVQPGAGKLRRRGGPAQGGRARVRVGQGRFARCLSDKRAPGEDSAHARGPDRPAHLRHRLRPSRLQRCRAPRRRPHPQAAARPRPGGGRVTGLAADAVAVSRTQPAAARSTTWGASWRRVLSSATAAGWGGFGASRSIWTRPTTRRTAPSSTASSMGTMTTGVTCRCSRS